MPIILNECIREPNIRWNEREQTLSQLSSNISNMKTNVLIMCDPI